MGDDGWRRAALDYRSKFEDDFVFAVPNARAGAPPLRIAQAPSASAAEKRVDGRRRAVPRHRRNADASAQRGGTASASSPPESDDAEDPIPATGFTVWDAGVLLGAYVSQPEVWHRLTKTTPAETVGKLVVPETETETEDAASEPKRERCASALALADSATPRKEPTVVIELGSGTGVAGLALASTGLPGAVCLTDLPGLCAFLRRNAERNLLSADAGSKPRRKENDEASGPAVFSGPAIPRTVSVSVVPLRWGNAGDISRIRRAFPRPDVVLGADLAYTEKKEVIDALAKTIFSLVPAGGVAVFASCRDHRPTAIDRLELLMTRGAQFEARVVQSDALAEGYGRSEVSSSFRVVEFRRVAIDPAKTQRGEA
jgi:predicted nicotinamide N-methyase